MVNGNLNETQQPYMHQPVKIRMEKRVVLGIIFICLVSFGFSHVVSRIIFNFIHDFSGNDVLFLLLRFFTFGVLGLGGGFAVGFIRREKYFSWLLTGFLGFGVGGLISPLMWRNFAVGFFLIVLIEGLLISCTFAFAARIFMKRRKDFIWLILGGFAGIFLGAIDYSLDPYAGLIMGLGYGLVFGLTNAIYDWGTDNYQITRELNSSEKKNMVRGALVSLFGCVFTIVLYASGGEFSALALTSFYVFFALNLFSRGLFKES